MLTNVRYTVTSNLFSFLISAAVSFLVPKNLNIEAYGYLQLYIFYTGYIGFLHFGWADGLYLRYGGKYYEDLDKHISRAKCYYQGNIPTQGIQIEVGGRVLATGLLSEIWRQDRNGDPVARHNHYNDFVGELVIPDLPRGVLATLNNKTSLDPQDPDWQAVFEKLSAYPPPKSATGDSEAVLKTKWMDILQAACPQDRVSDEQSVWSTGTRIDVVAENTGKLDIYELKTRKAEPLNLYQLKMYWDGLVVDKGKQPTSATLLAADYSSEILNMLNQMNALPPPCFADGAPSAPYNLKIATLAEKKLQ